jgi:hypothetical protein
MGARHRVGIGRVIVPARQATKAGGIHSLESIPGIHNCLKIPYDHVTCVLVCNAEGEVIGLGAGVDEKGDGEVPG